VFRPAKRLLLESGCVGSPRGAGFADVDAAIEVCKLKFGAAAVDCGVDGLVDLDKVFAAVAAPIFDGLLRRGSLNLDVEITENLSAIGLKAEVGFQIGWTRNVNVAVQRARLLMTHPGVGPVTAQSAVAISLG
jgi:hypothetical protein